MAKKSPVIRPEEKAVKRKLFMHKVTTPDGPLKQFYESMAKPDPLTSQPRYQFDPYVSSDDFYERFRIPRSVEVGEGKFRQSIPTKVSGNICVVERKRDPRTGKMTFESVRVPIRNSNWTGKTKPAQESGRKGKPAGPTVATLMASKKWKAAKVLESRPAVFESFDDGSDETNSLANVFDGGFFGPPNNEFVAIQPGPFNKQKYMYDYLKAHGWCFYFKNHSALAQALVNTKTNYVMGKGVQITALNDDLDEFIQDYIRVNDRQTNWWINCASTVWAGEFMDHKKTTAWDSIPGVSAFVDLAKKYAGKIFPTPKPVDPSSIWDYVTELTDITNIFYYHQQMQTQYQLTWKPGDKAAEYVINDIPADEIMFTKVNVVQGEKRGRGDLECVLPWLKLEEDYIKSKAFRAFVESSFVMKTKIMGDDDDVARYKDDPEVNRIPVPGSKVIENEAVDTTFMETKSSSSSQSDEVGESLKAKCAVGVGLSPEMVGAHQGSGGSGRQSGLMKAEPAHKSLEMRQNTMELAIRREMDWAINVARQNGLIPSTQTRQASLQSIMESLKKRDWRAVMREAASLVTMSDVTEPLETTYEVTFPEILSEDRMDKLKMLQMAEQMGWYDNERAGNMAAKEFSDTTYDWNKVQEKRREQAQQDPKVQAMYDSSSQPRPKPQPQQPEPPKAGSGSDIKNVKNNARRK